MALVLLVMGWKHLKQLAPILLGGPAGGYSPRHRSIVDLLVLLPAWTLRRRLSAGRALAALGPALAMALRTMALLGLLHVAMVAVRLAAATRPGRFVMGQVRERARLREKVLEILRAEPYASVEYVEFRHRDTLEEVERATDDTLLALAVRIGKTRLIDNIIVGRGFPCKEGC